MELNRIDTILDILDTAQNNQLHTLESETEIICIDFLLAAEMLEQFCPTEVRSTDGGRRATETQLGMGRFNKWS